MDILSLYFNSTQLNNVTFNSRLEVHDWNQVSTFHLLYLLSLFESMGAGKEKNIDGTLRQ